MAEGVQWLVRALLVEGDDFIRDIVHQQLAAIGLRTVEGVRNGTEALRSLHIRNYGLILSACAFPDMTGLQLLLATRNHVRQEVRNTPFVLMVSPEEKLRHGLEARRGGVSDCWCRPLRVEALPKQLEQVLSRRMPTE